MVFYYAMTYPISQYLNDQDQNSGAAFLIVMNLSISETQRDRGYYEVF